MKVNRSYKRGFLAAASAYRRNACGFDGDFGPEALREQYAHETFGVPVDKAKNGYAFGSMAMGVTLASMRDDLRLGDVTRHELLSSRCAAMRAAIRKFQPSEFFMYRDRRDASVGYAVNVS